MRAFVSFYVLGWVTIATYRFLDALSRNHTRSRSQAVLRACVSTLFSLLVRRILLWFLPVCARFFGSY